VTQSGRSKLRLFLALMRHLSILVYIAILLVACARNGDESAQFTLEANTQELNVSAVLDLEALEHQVNAVKYFGQVTIHNRTTESQPYSNRWLLLRSDSNTVSRAWLDNISSNFVDVGVIDIPPNDSVSLAVYWVVPKSEKGSVVLREGSLELDPEN